MNDNKNSEKENKHLSGRLVTYITLGTLAALIVFVAVFLSLYKPGTSKNPAFDTRTSESETTDATSVSVDPYARKKGVYTFLIAGTDNVSNSTDVLMLASFDTTNDTISIVQIPRDTYVNKDVGGYISVTRVNSVYAAAYNRAVNAGTRASSARHIAMKDLKARLEESLCVNLDYYVLVSTSSFRRIIDAVGGIWFDVPEDMDYEDPEQELYIHLKKGYQKLDGQAAEGLIRFRSGYSQGDLDRVSLRGKFLVAMASQIKSNLSFDTLSAIIGELISSVDTSVSLTDAVFFAKELYSVSTENIIVKTVSGSPVQNPETGLWSYYVLNRRGALADINTYLNVFSGDISQELFDKKGFFTDSVNESHAYINNYYLS